MREKPFLINGHLQQEPPDALYHYTSIEAAISILTGDTFWATDILVAQAGATTGEKGFASLLRCSDRSLFPRRVV